MLKKMNLRALGVTFLCLFFLSACGEKEQKKPAEPEKTVSDKAAQEITNYINEPQQKVRDANQMILDADQKRRQALDSQ